MQLKTTHRQKPAAVIAVVKIASKAEQDAENRRDLFAALMQQTPTHPRRINR